MLRHGTGSEHQHHELLGASMKHRFTPFLAALTIAATAAPAIHAQSARPFHVNIAAGGTIPTGDLGDVTNVGYNLTGGIGIKPPLSPFGFRAEGFFNEFGFKDDAFGTSTDSKFRVMGVNANVLYDLPLTAVGTGNALYAIGGLGYYNSKITGFDESASNVGWNIGAGFRFPLSGFSGYVEARYHTVSNDNSVGDAHFIPIVFGIVF